MAALMLAACSPPKEPLRIGVLVWPPYELAFLARDRGHYPTGQLELVNYHTPAEMLRAFRYGVLDGVITTSQFALDRSVLRAHSRLVYVIDSSAGGDSLIVHPDIKSLADLRGRRIGVEASYLGGYMLQRVLDHANLRRDQVQLAYVDTPDQEAAFREGRVDAVITYEPTRTRLLADGGKELFNSRSIPHEILDVLLVSKPALDERAPLLRDFVRGLARARDELTGGSKVNLAPLARRESLTKAEFRQALNGVELESWRNNRELLLGSPPPLSRYLQTQIEVMRRADLIEGSIDPVEIIDPRLVKEGGR